IAKAIRRDVREATGLAASAGIAPCKFVAKVASDSAKPDGLLVVRPGEEAAFLAPLPVDRMWGVGPKTAPRMRELGFLELGDLATADPATLERALGSWGAEVSRLARGEDDREVIPDGLAKSIGAEETYEEDLVGREAIGATLLAHAGRVARRLTRAGLAAHTLTVKVKYADFTLRTRRATLAEAVRDTDSIHRAAMELLARVPLEGRRVRLTGVSASGLVDGAPEPALFPDESAEKRRRVEELTARIADRYGDEHTVTRATLLGKRG
ncbi:MAG: DNA polymerase Y family protein, partial [Polyangiaceae bacterium]